MSVEFVRFDVCDFPDPKLESIELSTIDVYGFNQSEKEVSKPKVKSVADKALEYLKDFLEYLKDFADYGPMRGVSPERYEEIMKLSWTGVLANQLPSMTGAMVHHHHYI